MTVPQDLTAVCSPRQILKGSILLPCLMAGTSELTNFKVQHYQNACCSEECVLQMNTFDKSNPKVIVHFCFNVRIPVNCDVVQMLQIRLHISCKPQELYFPWATGFGMSSNCKLVPAVTILKWWNGKLELCNVTWNGKPGPPLEAALG